MPFGKDISYKFAVYDEKKRLKKLRRSLDKFFKVYNRIKPDINRLADIHKYVNKILELQERKYAKNRRATDPEPQNRSATLPEIKDVQTDT